MALSKVTSDSEDEMLESIRKQFRKLLKALSKANEKIDTLKNEKEVLCQINQHLVDENDILKNDTEVLQIDNERLCATQAVLEKENFELHSEIKELKERMDVISKDLSSTFHKFSKSDKKLQVLISSQRIGNSKIGLGFDQAESSNQPKKATVFIKEGDTKDKISIDSIKSSVATKFLVREKGYVRRYPQQSNNYPVRRYFRQSLRRFDRGYPN